MHRAGIAARFSCLFRPQVIGLATASAALLGSGQVALAQAAILNLLGSGTTTLQQLGTLNSTLQQLGVVNPALASLGVSNAAVQLGISSLQLGLTETSTAKTSALISGEVIAAQISGVVNDAFRSPFGFYDAFAAAGPGVYKAARAKPGSEREWLAWVDGRGTGWQNHNENSGLNGAQANVTGGIARKLTPDLLVGAFVDYESLKYNLAALGTDTRGQGGSVGAFAGWRVTPNVRLDASINYSRVSYSMSAGTANGSYGGNRWLATAGGAGSYEMSGFVMEPSANAYVVWEQDDAWTDSVGSLQPDRRFTAGRVSIGDKLTRPATFGSVKLAPYAGLYGDWRFSSGNALPAGVPVVGIGDGWSARVTSGVTFATAGPLAVSLGGEYGGIGAEYKVWTGNLRGTVRF